jgi:hypothetical protein
MMSKDSSLPSIESNFFLRRITFEDGRLTIAIGDDEAIHGTVVFDYVRTFLFFKESDFFGELAKYEHVKLIAGKERTVGVYRITNGPIMDRVLQGRLDQEQPQYFWVSSPDECLEVVAFDEPRLDTPNRIES